MGCGEFLVKYILFFANLVFALAGLAMLGLGIAAQLQIKEIIDLTDGAYQVAPITSMVVGSLVFLIAFFGCCGAIRESNCMLVTYSIFMLVLMVVKLTLAVLIFVNLDNIQDQVPKWLGEAFSKDPQGFHAIEATFHCCGTTGAISYIRLTLPDTCCETPPCILGSTYSGCNEVVGNFFNTFGMAIGILAISVVAVELVAAVFGLCLANHVRNKGRRARY